MPDGVTLNSPFSIAVNDQGQVLMIGGTNSSHQRLSLFDGSRLSAIAYFGGSGSFQTTSPSGGIFQSLNDLALNESGRAMIIATVTGGPGGMFYYDGASWKSVCVVGNCKLDGETVTSIGQLRAADNRFCAFFNTSNGNTRLDCWEDGAWTNIVKKGEVTSDGTELSFLNPVYDLNRRGDFAFSAYTGLGGPSVFLKNSDGFLTIDSAIFPEPDGPYASSIYSIDLRDDRRVYFLAMDNTSRIVVYEADPQF
jgi:hypothetical protein